MAARKRASNQSPLLNRAVKAGRSALRQAQRRLPPDVRKQIEKTVKDGQKTVHAAIKQVETRLDRTARQADLEKALKRLDELEPRRCGIWQAAAAASAASPRTSEAPQPARQRRAKRRRASQPRARQQPASRRRRKPDRARHHLAGAQRDDRPGHGARLPRTLRHPRATGINPAARRPEGGRGR